MANSFQRLRSFLERLVFAGLKPDAAVAQKKSKIASLLESAEALATRDLQPADKPLPGPMTLAQKLGIITGVLLVAVLVYVLVTVLRHPAQQAENTSPSAAAVEIVPKGFKVEKNNGLEVVEIAFDRNKEPKEITGTLRNLTDRSFARCEVSFDVTTRSGEQLGGVATTVNGLAPHASVKFRIFVPQKDASFAMVRELRTD